MKRDYDHIAYASRHYTDWRKPSGEVYREWHRQTPKKQHGVRRERDLTKKKLGV